MDWPRWSDENSLPGWLNLAEGQYLYESVFRLPAYSSIIEIGCYRGRSTIAMLQACADSEQDNPSKKIHSVDYFNGMGAVTDSQLPSAEQQLLSKTEFLNNINDWNLNQWFDGVDVMKSEEWFMYRPPDKYQYDMFFVDGYHPIVAYDMRQAWARLKIGGTLICHDYDIAAGGPIVDAINSAGLPGGHCGVPGSSLWVGTK